MIELRKITEDNFEACINLSLSNEQREYIASNAYSLCEAYALTNHKHYVPMPYAVYNVDVMVGFVMAVYQPIDEEDTDDDENVYYLSRIMIDRKYQGLGYGRMALTAFIELLKTYPYGHATSVVLSSHPANESAYKLFRSYGVKEMGEVDSDGDPYLILRLNEER